MKQMKSFLGFTTKVIALHTVTYFVFGLLMSNVFDYEEIFETDAVIKNFMRPIHSHAWLGLLLQPLRGALFAAGLWPFWRFIRERRNGWLLIWSLFVIFGILSPPAAAPSSIEGLIYSRIPLWYHLMGLPEVLLQTLSFSVGLWIWAKDESYAEIRSATSRAKDLLRAIVIGCFAYVGYAAGALLTLLVSSLRFASDSGMEIDREPLRSNFAAGASNAKLQLMFVVALIVNVVCIHLVERWRIGRRMRGGLVFLFFLGVDSAVPYLYQRLVLGVAPGFLMSLAIGLFPAMIIWFSLRESKPPLATTPRAPVG